MPTNTDWTGWQKTGNGRGVHIILEDGAAQLWLEYQSMQNIENKWWWCTTYLNTKATGFVPTAEKAKRASEKALDFLKDLYHANH